MPTYLRITIRFLQGVYHGRDDRGKPEWPPSPLRVFQALVASSASRWNERSRPETATPALRWLERQPAPSIVAAPGVPSGSPYRQYVPDNIGDKVAGAWSRGREASMADYRTEKDVRPTRLGKGHEAVHYLWPASGPDFDAVRDVLFSASKSITHVGWGVDMVAAEAEVISEAEVDRLDGERWQAADGPAGTALRVPVKGTLEALIAKHRAFLDRLGPEGGFDPVPPLAAFAVASYRRAIDVAPRPFAAFNLLKPDASGFRWFDPARSGVAVAGMMRHAASTRDVADSLGWSPERVAGFILGHGEPIGHPYAPTPGPRLVYLPLPSIEYRRGRSETIGGIRRVLIAASDARAWDDLRHVARMLSGSDLNVEGKQEPTALLSRIADSDGMVARYTRPATSWATVTPVVLPGHDDPRKVRNRLFAKSDATSQTLNSEDRSRLSRKLDERIEELIRKAIVQAGYPEVLARAAEIEWGGFGMWPGTEAATRFSVPERLRRFRRVHVRLSWRDANQRPVSVPGPICFGAGRFYGVGLFAGVRSDG